MQLLLTIVIIICSFRFQTVVDATTKVFTSAASNQGPSLLSVAREVEEFALNIYAEIHLNDTNKTLTFEKDALSGYRQQQLRLRHHHHHHHQRRHRYHHLHHDLHHRHRSSPPPPPPPKHFRVKGARPSACAFVSWPSNLTTVSLLL